MKIKRFKAPDMRQAIKMVREEHGADAVILSNRKVEGGIEIISAIDYDESEVEVMLNKQEVTPKVEPASLPQTNPAPHTVPSMQTVPEIHHTAFPTDNPFLQTAFQKSAQHLRPALSTSHEQGLNAETLAQAYANNSVLQNPSHGLPNKVGIQANEFQQAQDQQDLLHQQAMLRNENLSQKTAHPVIEQAQQVIAAAAAMSAVQSSRVNITESVPLQVPVAGIDDLDLEDDIATIRSQEFGSNLEKSSEPKETRSTPPVKADKQGKKVVTEPELSEEVDDSDYDTATNIVEQQLAENRSEERYRKKLDLESEQRNIEVQTMQRELSTLKGMLNSRMNQTPQVSIPHVHPAHTGIYARLQELGISSCLCQEVLSKLPLSSEVNEGWRKALAILAHGVKTVPHDILETGGVIAMVGSTGVGKTTTIAKMAAQYALKHGRETVAIVSVDNYRIAAQDQILSYGQMIGVPVFLATGPDDFSSIMGDLCDKQLILVDTAGMGQRDQRIADQLALVSEVPYDLQTYLVISANVQGPALNQIASVYADYKLTGCVLTKLDEAASLGSLLSMLTKWDIPISYLTEGQRVPEDISKARPYSLVSKAVTMMQQVEIIDSTSSVAISNNEDVYNAHA